MSNYSFHVRQTKTYTLTTVENFINDVLIPAGYEIITLREGTLLNDLVAIAPDEFHYNFVFRSRYVNEWSSFYTMRRCMKIGKSLHEEINKALDAA